MNFFDLHCDTAYECACMLGGVPLSEGAGHLSLKRGANISDWTQVFAIFMPDETADGKPVRGAAAIRHYELVMAYLKEQAKRLPDSFTICTNAEQLTREFSGCKALISVEGGSAAVGSLERLRSMYDDGVRMMTLTWNADNELGSGVRGSGGGLTQFGREAVAEMERLGMVVDVSHLSDAGFYDVAEIAKKPFAASHSCSRRLCGHPRNLTDEMFGIIRDMGGLVGINFSRGFLCEDENTDIEDILRHTEHFLSLGGENTVCMGSDFDGTDMPDRVSGVESMADLYELFLRHNYNEELVRKIMSENARKFFVAMLA